MSVIEKMSILGIRSFGPDDSNRQVIEFFKPLTLILGANGCGKTTIIECLRYMATGDTPPNSDRGGSFVHDPKLAGETEVKGQIKLQFRDVLGKKVIATRSLMVTQSVKKLTLKTLEGNITRYGSNNEKKTLSTKCAEIDAEMIGALGVSKAILNYVIFCHQEESNWPLSEGKSLKQKFDEIFAATRYIKALEEIRKIRLQKMSEIKIYETEVVSLMKSKHKAEEFKEELGKTETRLSACKDIISSIEDKLKPISEKLMEIKIKQNEIGRLQASLDSNQDIIKKYEKDEMDLRNSIQEMFQGSKEELVEEMQNFDSVMSVKMKKLDKIKQDIMNFEKKRSVDLKLKSRLLEEMGKLKADHDRHKELLTIRDSKLRVLRKKFGLGDFDEDEALAESQIENVLRNLKQRNKATQNELVNCKTKHETNESRIQNDIEKTIVEKAQKQQKLSSSNEQIAKNKTAIRNINAELSHLDSLASRQDDLEEDLKEAEVELKNLESSVNLEDLREQLSSKQKRKADMESQLSALSQEMNQLLKESKVRNDIDLVNREITSKQDAVSKIIHRHKDTIEHLLHEMPEHDIHEKVANLVNKLNTKVQATNKDIEKKRSQLSSLETTKKYHESNLQAKEKTLSEYQAKIFDVCGSQDFDYGVDNLKSQIKELQDEKGALTGSLYLYNKYVEKLGKPRPCCPLCSRNFQRDEEAESLISKLQKKLQTVPSALETKSKLIAEKEKNLNKMLELKPLKEFAYNLTEKDIPDLKSKIENAVADISKTNSEISQLEEILDDLSSDHKTASSIVPDLIILDQNKRELDRLKGRLSGLKSQIGGKDTSRTVQQASDEQNALQKTMRSLNQEVEATQKEINDYREHLQEVRGRINDLKAKKIKMSNDLQKKESLVEQLDTLGKENSSLMDVVKDVKSEILSLKTKLDQLGKDKEAATKVKETELEVIRAKIKEEDKEMENINQITNEINNYIHQDKEKKLMLHEDKLNSISSEIEMKNDEINNLNEKEKELNQDITSQKEKYRDLKDNMRLMEVLEKISKLHSKCQNIKEEIGGYNIRTLLSDADRLAREEKSLTKEKDESAGRENALRDQIKTLKKHLQDDMFKDADKKHNDKCIELRTTQLVCDDLNKYYTALNRAIMSYHKLKMNEINKIIKDLWIKTYAGSDIDYIEIQSDEDEGGGLDKAKRQYNYRVVMFKGNTPTDMRGRCSAGQKVLASLIIRLALAETFCLNCGILALDEPTTNLDNENISNLARALVEIVVSRSEQRNFQLIIITHDQRFIELLGRSDTVDYFYKVSKDDHAYSKLTKIYIGEIN